MKAASERLLTSKNRDANPAGPADSGEPRPVGGTASGRRSPAMTRCSLIIQGLSLSRSAAVRRPGTSTTTTSDSDMLSVY
jgi:hypothetical protein